MRLCLGLLYTMVHTNDFFRSSCIYVMYSVYVSKHFWEHITIEFIQEQPQCIQVQLLEAWYWGLNMSPGVTPAIIRMMTSSNGNIFRVTGHLCGEFTGPGEFPTQRPVTRSFDAFFDLRLNKRLSRQPWGWWFETPSWSLWRQCNGTTLFCSEIRCLKWVSLNIYWSGHSITRKRESL